MGYQGCPNCASDTLQSVILASGCYYFSVTACLFLLVNTERLLFTATFSSQLCFRVPLPFGGLPPSVSPRPPLPALQASLGSSGFILQDVAESEAQAGLSRAPDIKINQYVWIFGNSSQSHWDNSLFCMK